MTSRSSSFVPTQHHASYPAISETNLSLSCEGKVIFITGGGRGIGRAIAKSFATARAEGIFIVGRNKKSLQDTVNEIAAHSDAAVSVHYAVADILDAESVSAALQKAIATFGQIDVLVQNVGYLDGHRSIVDSDLDDYWHTFEVNVKGGLTFVQAFLRTSPKPGSSIIAARDDIGLPGSFCVWLVASKNADVLKGRMVWANWDVEELKRRADEIQRDNLLTQGLRGWN